MRETLLEILACPICRSAQLKLEVRERDAREIHEGQMLCQICGAVIPIQKGFVQALLNLALTVAHEAKG